MNKDSFKTRPLSVSVVICTYNRSASLRATLDSLAQASSPPGLDWELIVIDNASTDQTRAAVKESRRSLGTKLRYVFEPKHGLSYGRNRGIREARGEIILFTDDDVTAEEHWLVHMKQAFDRFGCLAVGGKVIPLWAGPKPAWFEEEGPYSMAKAIVSFDLGSQPCETRVAPFGANMGFKQEAFAKYGLFRTDLGRTRDGLMGGEDKEFFSRLLDHNERLVYTPNAIVYHPVPRERTRRSYFQSWYFSAGRSQVRWERLPRRAVCYRGVPRYLLRMLLHSLLRWCFAINPKRRFYHKLQVCSVAGMIAESIAHRPRTVLAA
jgi:glucosyl-dolichyl phosphate glucuronosyltransferase